MSTPTPCSASSSGAVAATSSPSGALSVVELGVEGEHPAAEGAQRELGARSAPGRRPGAGRSAAATPARCRWRRPGAGRRRSSGAVKPRWRIWLRHLIRASTGRALGDQQRPDGFHDPSPVLATALAAARSTPHAPLRRVELDRTCRCGDAPGGSVDRPRSPRPRRRAGTGPGPRRRRRCPPHRPASSVTEADQPAVQLAVAGRWSSGTTRRPALRRCIQRRRDMHIKVRVDTARDRARALYDGHRHPFSLQLVKGWLRRIEQSIH